MKKFYATLVLLAAVALGLSPAIASAAETATYICVPETAGSAVTSGGSEGKCEAKHTTVELPPTAELATLQSILPHIKYEAEGIDKKPTVQFSGANVEIVNGEGKTATTNGEGNLVIGYDENEEKHEQTGSHNLILGPEQTFTGYGDVLAGKTNDAISNYDLIAGANNSVSAVAASVTGGWHNTASATYSSVTGGAFNTASKVFASASGGYDNTASGESASVSGGYENKASGSQASVLGGNKNLAEGMLSVIYGGKELKTTKEYEVIG
jgi:hypothetical protein